MLKERLTLVLMKDAPKTPAEALRKKQGALILQFRDMHAMTQAELADAVGVTKAAVSEWELGKSSPRPHIQIAIATALRAPWSVLFGLDGAA